MLPLPGHASTVKIRGLRQTGSAWNDGWVDGDWLILEFWGLRSCVFLGFIDCIWNFWIYGHAFSMFLLTSFGSFGIFSQIFIQFFWPYLRFFNFQSTYPFIFIDLFKNFGIFSQPVPSFSLTYFDIFQYAVKSGFYLAISSTRITILFLQLTPKYPNSLSSIWFYNHPPLHTIPVWRKHHYFLTFPSRKPRHFTHSQSDVSPLFSKRAHRGVQRGGGLATPSRPFAYF